MVTTAVQADASVDKSGNNPASGLALLFDQDLGDDSPILLAQRPWRRGQDIADIRLAVTGVIAVMVLPPHRHWGYHRGWVLLTLIAATGVIVVVEVSHPDGSIAGELIRPK